MNAKQVQQSQTVQQYSEYFKAFQYFNERLFGGKLPEPMLSFGRPKNPKTEAFTVFGKWANDKGEKLNEVSISTEIFGSKTPEQLFALLVREMCKHAIWCLYPDKLPEGNRAVEGKAMTYTNEHLANQFKLVGLKPHGVDSKTGKKQPERETGQGIACDIIPNGAFARAAKEMPKDISLPWSARPDAKRVAKAGEKKQGRVKYVATAGDDTVQVWAKPGLTIKVQIGKKMVTAEPESGATEQEKAA